MIFKPYTYLIKHNETGMVYYGVRWKNISLKLSPQEDLWKVYFTGSNKVKQLIKEYGVNSFSFEIRREFDTIEQARKWETKVLKRMKVLNKPDLWLTEQTINQF